MSRILAGLADHYIHEILFQIFPLLQRKKKNMTPHTHKNTRNEDNISKRDNNQSMDIEEVNERKKIIKHRHRLNWTLQNEENGLRR